MTRGELNKIASYLYHTKTDNPLWNEIWETLKVVSAHSKSIITIPKELEAKILIHKAAAENYYKKVVVKKKKR